MTDILEGILTELESIAAAMAGDDLSLEALVELGARQADLARSLVGREDLDLAAAARMQRVVETGSLAQTRLLALRQGLQEETAAIEKSRSCMNDLAGTLPVCRTQRLLIDA